MKTKPTSRSRTSPPASTRSAAHAAFLVLAGLVLCAPAAGAQQTMTFSADRTQSVFAEGRERI
ncbi:MAG: hypothetical protein ACOCW3_02895, partial [Spirochaetota bacterium]